MRYYFNYNRQTGRIPRSVDQVDFPDFMKPLNTLFKEGWNTSVLAHGHSHKQRVNKQQEEGTEAGWI
jgi:hypothetical protein